MANGDPTPSEEAHAAVQQAVQAGRLHRFDTRAILALISVIGAFAYQGALLVVFRDSGPDANFQIPSWMSAVTLGITGFYYGSKATGGGNGSS